MLKHLELFCLCFHHSLTYLEKNLKEGMLGRQEDPWAPLRTYRNSLLQEAPGEQSGKSHKHIKKHRKGGVKRKLAMQGGEYLLPSLQLLLLHPYSALVACRCRADKNN